MYDCFTRIPEEQSTHIAGTPFDLAEVYYALMHGARNGDLS